MPLSSSSINKSESFYEKFNGPPFLRAIFSSTKRLFASLLIFRVCNALLIQTTFVPDEHWQSVEIAHRWAFGYGHLTWEWHNSTAIRSSLYPLLFALPFKLAHTLELDSRLVILKLPSLLHAILAATADLHLYWFSRSASQSARIARYTLANHVINWFTMYAGCRTLTNTFEWALTCIALAYLPWSGLLRIAAPCQDGDDLKKHVHLHSQSHDDDDLVCSWKFPTLVALCCLIRPTALVIWAPLCVFVLFGPLLFSSPQSRRSVSPLIWTTLRCNLRVFFVSASAALCVSVLSDRCFYARWTLTQWNFVRFNVLTGIAAEYGSHAWHWYLSNATPSMLATQLPLLIGAAAFNAARNHKEHFHSQHPPQHTGVVLRLIVFVCVFSLTVYSLFSHKEYRFVFPILPLIMHLLGCAFVQFLPASSVFSTSSSCSSLSLSASRNANHKTSSKLKSFLIGLLIITQLPLALFTLLLHQRGGLDLMMSLGSKLDAERAANTHTHTHTHTRVLLLMPCHSVPHLAALHHNISLRFLTCNPVKFLPDEFFSSNQQKKKKTRKNVEERVDEAEQFYANPHHWLTRNLLRAANAANQSVAEAHRWPDYIVTFHALLNEMSVWLQNVQSGSTRQRIPFSYRVCHTFFHTYFPTHSRHSQRILVFCRSDRVW